MGQDAPATTLPATSTGNNDVAKPCVTCGQTKRLLCIRAREKPNFGHANLALVEVGPDGKATAPPTTYGNWPVKVPRYKQATTVRTNDPEDQKHDTFKYVRCKEVTKEQEEKVKKATENQKYDYFDKNCARWSADTWNNVTGENLDYGASSNWVYNGPDNLGNSITSQNGGMPSNFNGSF